MKIPSKESLHLQANTREQTLQLAEAMPMARYLCWRCLLDHDAPQRDALHSFVLFLLRLLLKLQVCIMRTMTDQSNPFRK